MRVEEELIALIAIPILLFCVTTILLVLVPKLLAARERRRLNEILGKGLESGSTLPPDILQALTGQLRQQVEPFPLRNRDLRLGVLWVSCAIGIGLFAFSLASGIDLVNTDISVREPLWALGIAAFPFAVGIGYIVLGLVGGTKKN